jgi:hypothetical protein
VKTDDLKEPRSTQTVDTVARPETVLDQVGDKGNLGREEPWAKKRETAHSEIAAALGRAHLGRAVLAHKMHWGEAVGVVALTASLALVLGRLWPSTPETPWAASLRAVDSKGQILCDRDDGRHFTSCNPERESGIVGLRTLDQSGVTVETASGVTLSVEASSTLRIADPGVPSLANQVMLSEGLVDVRVPKTSSSQQFAILTPHATITARGTAFSVDVAKRGSQTVHTCVRLREGALSIASNGHEDQLVAPANWGCPILTKAANPVDAGGAPAPLSATSSDDATRPYTDSVRRPKATEFDHASLAAQARLMDRARRSERHNDPFTAEELLKQLLVLYPNSPVAPEARAALERISSKRRKSVAHPP